MVLPSEFLTPTTTLTRGLGATQGKLGGQVPSFDKLAIQALGAGAAHHFVAQAIIHAVGQSHRAGDLGGSVRFRIVNR